MDANASHWNSSESRSADAVVRAVDDGAFVGLTPKPPRPLLGFDLLFPMFFEEACDAVVDDDDDDDGGEDVLVRRGSRVLETAKAATSSRLPMDASSSSCERRRNHNMFVCFVQFADRGVQSEEYYGRGRRRACSGGDRLQRRRRSVNNDGG